MLSNVKFNVLLKAALNIYSYTTSEYIKMVVLRDFKCSIPLEYVQEFINNEFVIPEIEEAILTHDTDKYREFNTT